MKSSATGGPRPRILQVIPSLASAFGGPAVGAAYLNEAFNRAGAVAHIVSAAYGQPDPPRPTRAGCDDDVPEASIEGTVFSASRPFRAENSWRLAWYLCRHIRSYDVVHVHGFYRAPTTLAYLLSKLNGVPYGVQVHGNLEPYQRREKSGLKRVWDLVVTRPMIKSAQYVVFASQSEADRAGAFKTDGVRIVTPLGAALAPPTRKQKPRVFNRAVFLGRFTSKKQLDVLLSAWSLIPEQDRGELCIVGPEGDWSHEQIRTLATELGVQDTVRVMREVTGAAKRDVLESAAVFCLPSRNENFGIAIAEAMLAGCFVITTPEVAAGEHVRSSRSGVIVPGNAADIALAISEAFQDAAGTSVAGQRGSEYAKAELTWDKTAASILSLVDELRSSPESGRDTRASK